MKTETNPLLRLVGILLAVSSVPAHLWASPEVVQLLLAAAWAFTFMATRPASHGGQQ